jgi:hypothetical protein
LRGICEATLGAFARTGLLMNLVLTGGLVLIGYPINFITMLAL